MLLLPAPSGGRIVLDHIPKDRHREFNGNVISIMCNIGKERKRACLSRHLGPRLGCHGYMNVKNLLCSASRKKGMPSIKLYLLLLRISVTHMEALS
jgi:hypothetical protein